MGKRVTNINRGGTVGIQSADSKGRDKNRNKDKDRDTEVTNSNEGGTVGIQGGHVSGETVVINGEGRR